MSKTGPAGPRPATSRFSWWRYAVLGAVLVATVAFAIVIHNSSAPRSGPATPGGAPGERGLPVGASVPLLSLQSTDGTAISLDQLRGSKVVVYFYEGGG